MSNMGREFQRQEELKELRPPDPDDIDYEYELQRDHLADAMQEVD